MIRAAAIAAGTASASVLVGVGILFAIIELDDGRHDIFGPESPATVPPVQTPRLHLVRP